MNRGFYTIMGAQFFSSLADNALLIAAFYALAEMNAPEWMTPMLKFFFVASYVLLAAFVGAFSDSMPKGRVMFITNVIKIVGCGLMFVHVHPLVAYGVVGIGAAAYSPAKYGILTELLPAEKLVAANGWIEGLTVASIILGAGLGGALINPQVSATLLSFKLPLIHSYITTPLEAALSIVMVLYIAATIFNLYIPDTGARYTKQATNPIELVTDFGHCCAMLWRDKLGQITLAITTLFWGAGAVLQFLVIYWAQVSLKLPLDKAAVIPAVSAIGIAFGAIAAGRYVPIKKSLSVMPYGVAMGVVVMSMTMVHSVWVAYPLLVIIGALSGFFVVPMNALLQHRGHVLMSAGHSISVQNFNENVSILIMMVMYTLMVKSDLSINIIIVAFGLFVSSSTLMVMRKHRANQREHDSLALIGEHKH
ncbi:lysophospholipid transporter LplT [Solimicrobium silvestre]|uniref:Major Facilitator Superfamily n=1 Tax=Solimicrobium silvestre TaxID=2099400 RepID=A0A2S9GUV3_9BURK|nr:lysophospholipid transporter LplT [Solimicrobium silvestre]PRC91512.1 Major Facilitator Superfamily [Solimicrobium silvestre]